MKIQCNYIAGVRPYKCNLCEKSFTQRCSLESHCLKVHGVAHQYDYKQRRSKVSEKIEIIFHALYIKTSCMLFNFGYLIFFVFKMKF